MTERKSLYKHISNYRTAFPEEAVFISAFLTLLRHPRCFHRDHLPGHITASSWIINPDHNHVLLTHHAKLNRWLQPGGHADGEEDVLAVAMREAMEETGLRVAPVSHDIFDIDIHAIPARPDFPQHDHYDVRFCVEANPEEKLVVTSESHELRWVPISELAEITGNNESMLRMARKLTSR